MQTRKLIQAAVGSWKELALDYKTVESLTAEVNLVNSSARIGVSFDDLTVTTELPVIVQENHRVYPAFSAGIHGA
ncbi:hypothetical protein QNI19_19095 [Cytophagaceae bacterium DM2B3-1]|uniref:Uncharacterized protein n=1 Tax=Xanthocytophaga flava TaxID=3048013 RepID=A0ABT7CQX1_9BACT|nr:hypothetical protein [Xanthocytophaga flavus]